MSRQQRIVITGAGIVGLSTAYALLKAGMQQVTVLEQEVVDHRRATSSGPSRLLRFEYGFDSFYSRMVQLSLSRWRSLQLAVRSTLYTSTGLLVLGNQDDNFTQSSYTILQELGLPIERISEQECKRRFPQFSTHAYDTLTYNAEGGILHASNCLRALKGLVTDLGGQIVELSRVTAIESKSSAQPIRVRLHSGDELAADRVVIAAGPWVHRLLSDLRLPVWLTRQYVLYFSGLPMTLFSVDNFPAFISHDLYGFPLHISSNGNGPALFKAASHTFGAQIDLEENQFQDEWVIAKITRRLQDLVPSLHYAELARVDSCMYDVTPDEDFILDYLPHDARVVFATGLSGHGFKFGVLLGELLSSMVRETSPQVPLERFRLARFAQRTICQETSVA